MMERAKFRDAVADFYALEAHLLDAGLFDEWFDLLADDIFYEVPVRETTYTREQEFANGGYRLRDDKEILGLRIKRLKSDLAYAELPPSRTVRSVSSIAILSTEGDLIQTSNAVIVYRNRANDLHGDTIHARREDTLRLGDDGLRLVSRVVRMADISMGTPNLGIFF